MKLTFHVSTMIAMSLTALSLFLNVGPASAQKESIIYNFPSSEVAPAWPAARLVADGNGNFFGTSWIGGANGTGTVYELQRNTAGEWLETTLYSFPNQEYSYEANAVTLDHQGNIFGSTLQGGGSAYCSDDQDNAWGCGTVYELSPNGAGGWTEKTLYTFLGPNDGEYVGGSLVIDSAGNLYGVINQGGATTNGGVFELSPQSDGTWLETEIYSFVYPEGGSQGPLTIDSAGHLYGSVSVGVYELSSTSSGVWKQRILYDFAAHNDGAYPTGGLIFDKAGNLYGTTKSGGSANMGTVFKLSPTHEGMWSEAILHNFGNTEGDFPSGNLVHDDNGNLYGTLIGNVTTDVRQSVGGCLGGAIGCGLVYEITPAGNNDTYRVLHAFAENGVDGYFPLDGVTLDPFGRLFGTTIFGGSQNAGTVFQLSH